MTGIAAEQELYQACRVIFGPDLRISREFLEYIQFSGVKSAFRKKAMETHPDRLANLDEPSKKRSALLFYSAQQAYEKLMRYLEAREKGFRFHGNVSASPTPGRPVRRNPYPTKSHGGKGFSGQDFTRSDGVRQGKGGAGDGEHAFSHHALYRGPIPNRQLLFGHYLYYAGRVSWQSLIKALVWQKAQRPQLGEMARQRGWLTSEDIPFILKRSISSHLPFGQQALQLGLLTRQQLHFLLFEQRRRHKKFGEFFVHHNILTLAQLEILLFRFQRHNAQLARSCPGWTR